MQVQMSLRFRFRLGFIVYLEIRLALRLVRGFGLDARSLRVANDWCLLFFNIDIDTFPGC